jgi:hypothetical protein
MIQDNMKKNIQDWGATLLGLLAAVATGLMVIDWTDFHFKKEWPKLIMLAVIAAGGYFSKLKGKKDDTTSN